MPPQHPAPWKPLTIYQIYPSSFLSSSGSTAAFSNTEGANGDLKGITAKLDYLKDLGADVVWLSPIYESPGDDAGYDISDYQKIDPRYGTLKDWDALRDGLHARGMKLMMDLVVNHTSDQHAWFKSSASSESSTKHDWYIWRPPRYDKDGNMTPPNNWKSVFQGSAWTYHPSRKQYYLHLYLPSQPDLNWESTEVRDAVYEDIMGFWIKRGIDGFRMDVINLISKVPGLPDAPVTLPDEKWQPAAEFYVNGPRVHEFLKEMNERVLSKQPLITVGEAPFSHSPSALSKFVVPSAKELNMVFQFELMDLDSVPKADFDPFAWRKPPIPELGKVLEKWQTLDHDKGYWNAVYTENHDQARSVTRFGNDSDDWRVLSAKMLSIMAIAQGGSLFVYQGQELGVRNAPKSWGIEEYKDIASVNYWNQVLEQRKKSKGTDKDSDIDMSDVLAAFQKKARDHARLPMPWNSEENGGFSKPGTKPWMSPHPDYKHWNAEVLLEDRTSAWWFWKEAIALRKKSDVLLYGTFDLIESNKDHPQVLAFTRKLDNDLVLTVMNFSEDEKEINLPIKGMSATAERKPELLIGNYAVGTQKISVDTNGAVKVRLRGWEGAIWAL